MARGFWLACAACISYDVFGFRYDKHHNRGIGPVLFASICIATAGFESMGLPERDAGHKIIAFSLILWPGVLWGMVLFPLLSNEDKASCLWLILCPLFIVVLGLPILVKSLPVRGPMRKWRIATGLSSIGILIGHFLSKSSLSRTIDEHVSGHLTSLSLSTFQALIGASIIFLSVARMARDHSQAARSLQWTKRLAVDSVTPNELPPFWGVQGPFGVIAWTIGLALCVSTIDDAQARATLVSTSVAIELTMALLPPFVGKIWALSYEDHVQLLFILHIVSVLVIVLVSYLGGKV